jgi:hypothetical protein
MTNRFYHNLACLSGTIYKPPFQGVAAAPLRMGLPADLGLRDKGNLPRVGSFRHVGQYEPGRYLKKRWHRRSLPDHYRA